MKKIIGWVLPFPKKGSGGQRTNLQNINALEKRGYSCHVFLMNKLGLDVIKTESQAKKIIDDYFGKTEAKIYLGWDVKGSFDLLVATWWESAKIVRDYSYTRKKAYFIQDFEAGFYPMGDAYLMAENTYKYGLEPITIGRWLAQKMQNDFSSRAQFFDFCADINVYKNTNKERESNSVCMIYQPEKPRRCPVMGIEALGIVKHFMPETKIYLYGSNEVGNIWFDHENLKIMSVEKCAELYNKVSVGLCISSSNPSRIPFEMMACGLPVVDIYRENNLFDMPSEGVLLAEQTPESIAGAIMKLLKNKQKRSEMGHFGINFMKRKSLEFGFNQFVIAVENILENKQFQSRKYEPFYKSKMYLVGDIESFRIPPHKNDITFSKKTKQFIYQYLLKFERWLKIKIKLILFRFL